MSPEKQRIRIAEACGWHSFRDIGGDSETKLWGHPAHLKQTTLPTELVPDYLSDLNAMHEAETLMIRSLGMDDRYADEVTRIAHAANTIYTLRRAAISATAAQRAEAFLRALGLWEDEEGHTL